MDKDVPTPDEGDKDRLFMESFAKLNDPFLKLPEERVHVYRELVTQAADKCLNNEGTSGVAGLLALKDLIRTTGELVDDPKGINNYSDMCLNESDKFVNHSAKWKSGLSLDNLFVQKFINDHNKLAGGSADDSLSDDDWDRCMKIKIPELRKKAEPETNKNNSSKPSALSNFDLCDDDLMDDLSEIPEEKQSSFDKFIFSKEIEGEVKSSWTENREHSDSKRNTSWGLERKSSVPPRSAFVDKVWGKRGGLSINNRYPRDGMVNSHAPPKQNLTPAARNEFRTAGQQFAIDRAKKNETGPISSSSYGTGRKHLGVNKAPTSIKSAFKPPIRSSVQDESGSSGSWGQHSDRFSEKAAEDEESDPRYKNIDMKMVELIKNEIMDCGQRVEWDDIAGLEFAKETVKEIVVYPLLRPDIFTGLRGPPKGLLLFGPPGTGKTLIGKCIAHEANCTFFSISASSLTSKWVGEGEKMVRALFAVAKVHQPSVVFIDEIDSLLTSRSEGEHESSRKIKTEFLVQLDGANCVGEERVLVVGATNRPQELDDAARRRLVKRLYIPLPDPEARASILARLLGRERHDVSEEDMKSVSLMTEGYSGADMANLCREAAYGPIRSLDMRHITSLRADQVRPIHHTDLISALRQVKASVSQQDLDQYIEWDKRFGASK